MVYGGTRRGCSRSVVDVREPAVHIRKTCGFSHSRASPYENRHGQIRLQAADLSLTVFALLIDYAHIIS